MPTAPEANHSHLVIQHTSTTQTSTMATSTQYERDLRSARKEWKRGKDSSVKWSHGSRPVSGVKLDMFGQIWEGSRATECQLAKSRPEKKFSEG